MTCKATVLIPTRGRWGKLQRTLDSIGKIAGVKVLVVCDGDESTIGKLNCTRPDIEAYLLPGHNGAVKCRNWAMLLAEGHVINATDDIVFHKGAIKNAIAEVEERFDGDGVIGFWQDYAHHEAGVCLLGDKFLDRYPHRKYLCPEYFHFAIQEVKWLADSVDRFYYAEDRCKIHHMSPFRDKSLMDQCHSDGRIKKLQDHALIKLREEDGLIWGKEENPVFPAPTGFGEEEPDQCD